MWEAFIKENYRKYLGQLRQDAIDSHGSLSASRDHPPYFMNKQVWRDLLNVWDSDRYKALSKQQSSNRASVSFPHNSGPIPFDIRRARQV